MDQEIVKGEGGGDINLIYRYIKKSNMHRLFNTFFLLSFLFFLHFMLDFSNSGIFLILKEGMGGGCEALQMRDDILLQGRRYHLLDSYMCFCL